ncbi:MAG: NfuA family Fe-S biogenesis protein [Xanthomonadales bacterium]|nr:NfuA family Fe-S biogenesis protein [Xanthomonadales bacterium]
MIEITPSAQEYFGKLIEQQEMDDIGLHLTVLKPGTPLASCDLQFHVAGQSGEKELEFNYDLFNLYVPASSEQWLDKAKIDFEKSAAGGQLTIKAPGIKGTKPAESAVLSEKVAWVLEAEINPGLASHGGMVTLEQITEATEVILRFGGGCQGCGMANVTLQEGIEKTLKGYFPEITAIIDATVHAEGENPYYK